MPYISTDTPAQTEPRATTPVFRIPMEKSLIFLPVTSLFQSCFLSAATTATGAPDCTGNATGMPRELHGLYAGVSRERCKLCNTPPLPATNSAPRCGDPRVAPGAFYLAQACFAQTFTGSNIPRRPQSKQPQIRACRMPSPDTAPSKPGPLIRQIGTMRTMQTTLATKKRVPDTTVFQCLARPARYAIDARL